MFTRESITKELKRINDSVPELLRRATLIETKATPELEMLAQKAQTDPDFPQAKKEQIQKMYDSGIFSKKRIVENAKVVKMRNDFVNRAIKKAVKEGRLPNKKQLAKLKLNELHEQESIHKEVA